MITRQMNTSNMSAFLAQVSARHRSEFMIMVVDGASSHVCKDLVVPRNIRLLRLPPYAPELNPVEYIWGYMKQRELGNLCLHTIAQVGAFARNRLKSMQRRPRLITAFWKQTELAI